MLMHLFYRKASDFLNMTLQAPHNQYRPSTTSVPAFLYTVKTLAQKRIRIGKITAEIAKAKAETEFEKYRVIQDRLFMSDFDKYMLELEENAKK